MKYMYEKKIINEISNRLKIAFIIFNFIACCILLFIFYKCFYYLILIILNEI